MEDKRPVHHPTAGLAPGYVFAAAVFRLFCFLMSRYSIYTERRLNAGPRG